MKRECCERRLKLKEKRSNERVRGEEGVDRVEEENGVRESGTERDRKER